MTITIKINTDNAAFGDNEGLQLNADRDAEVSRILREWAARIPEDGYGATLHDHNGNTVGTVTVRGK